jgi:multidrug resistance efflux pump
MKWRVTIGVLMVLSVAVAGLSWIWASVAGARSKVLQLHGVVEIQEVRLASKQGGRIKDVLVAEGNWVEPGQRLVVLEAPELKARKGQQEAQLANILAELEKARNGPRTEEKEAAAEAAEAAEARWKRLKTGFREEEKRQAKSDLDAAEADLKLAEEELARADRLVRQKMISAAEFDQYHANYDRARGRAAAARARFEMMKAGSRVEEIAEAAALLKQAKANLRLLRAGTRPEDIAMIEAKARESKAKIDELDAQIDEAEVRAPSRAIIDVLPVRRGDVLASNQTVARILKVEDLWVKVYVPETELGKIRLQQEVEVTVDSYPHRWFKGNVTYISSQSEFTPRNVQSIDERRHQVFGIKVRVNDPAAEGVLKSGMAATVFVQLAERPAL